MHMRIDGDWSGKQEVSLQGKVITILANLLPAANMSAWKKYLQKYC